MKTNKIYLMTVAALLLLAGCTEDIMDEGRGPVPVSLTATMECDSSELVTRAGTSVLNSFSSGDAFRAYFPSNVRVSSTTSGSSTTYSYDGSSWSPATQPYFNAGASSCTVHAYYPSSHTNATNTFSVQLDQSSTANYKSSDLMYATATIQKNSPTGSLTFAHRMAKVMVSASAGSGVSQIQGVYIINGYRTINISTPQSCTLGSTLSNALSTSTKLTMLSSGSSSSASCAALIPPQTISSGDFLQIVTNAGTATYSLASSKSFESGKSYQLNITVNAAAVGTTTSITGWTDTGNVTVQPVAANPWNVSVSGTYTYDGSVKTPGYSNVSVTDAVTGNPITSNSSNFTIYCENNTNAGTAKLAVWGKGTYFGKYAETTFTINKAAGYVTLSATSATKSVSTSGSFTVKTNHGGTLSVAKQSGTALTSGPSLAGTTVSYTAPSSVGSTVIRVTCAESANYLAATADFTLTTIAYMADATGDDVGKVICSNGHIHTNVSGIDCGGSASAMIAYVGSQNGNDGTSAYSSTYNHGLAIALADVINTSGDKQTSTSGTSLTWANASTACSAYKGARPSDVTWQLPTAYQWERMLRGCGSSASFISSESNFSTNDNSFRYGDFRSKLTSCGSNSEGVYDVRSVGYWSATEKSAYTSRAWFYSFYYNKFYFNDKAEGLHVRPCFAF